MHNIDTDMAFLFGGFHGVIYMLLAFFAFVYPKLKKIDKEYKELQSENTRLKNALKEMGWF